MTVYAVAQITIRDRRRDERYASRFVGLLAGFGGRLLAADTSPEVLSGEWPHDKLVLLEFADRALLDRWARSPEYIEISTDRVGATTGSVLLVAALRRATMRPGRIELAEPSAVSRREVAER